MAHKKVRERYLEFVKKELDIYGWSKPVNFKDRVNDIRKVVLLCPNITKVLVGEVPPYVSDRGEYLKEVEKELEEKGWVLEEWEFDSIVFKCPNYILPPDANKKHNDVSVMWKKFHMLDNDK